MPKGGCDGATVCQIRTMFYGGFRQYFFGSLNYGAAASLYADCKTLVFWPDDDDGYQ